MSTILQDGDIIEDLSVGRPDRTDPLHDSCSCLRRWQYVVPVTHAINHLANHPDIASISAIEGKNWRHGDIEDVLKQVACIKHHKWNTMMMKRVYFGYGTLRRGSEST